MKLKRKGLVLIQLRTLTILLKFKMNNGKG